MFNLTRTYRLVVFAATLLAVLTIAGGAMAKTSASAAAATPLQYDATVEDRHVLVDTGVIVVSGCLNNNDDPRFCLPDYFPGTAWVRVRAGVKVTSTTSQQADLTVDAGGKLKSSSSQSLKTKLTAHDGAGNEFRLSATPFVNVDVAYDAPWANCPRDTITSGDQLEQIQQPGTCLDWVRHTGDMNIAGYQLLQADTVLPYSGTATFKGPSRTSPSVDLLGWVGLPNVLTGRLELLSDIALTAAAGYTADRSVVASSGETIASGPFTWGEATEQTDMVSIPDLVDGTSLEYRLANVRWDGSAKVTGRANLILDFVGVASPLPDPPPIPVFSATLYEKPIVARAADVTQQLGVVNGTTGHDHGPNPSVSCDVLVGNALLWPANGKFKLVTVTPEDGLTLEIDGVQQDERVAPNAPDAKRRAAPNEVLLRAERDAKGDGRVYTISFTVKDDGGNECKGAAEVKVPRSKNKPAIKSALSVNSFAKK